MFHQHLDVFEMSLFQIHGQMNLFCGGKFSDRVSSDKLLAVSAAGPPAFFFFQKFTFLDFVDMPIFGGKSVFAQIWSDLVYLNLEILKDQAFWYET